LPLAEKLAIFPIMFSIAYIAYFLSAVLPFGSLLRFAR
jgi:hypothetical protein